MEIFPNLVMNKLRFMGSPNLSNFLEGLAIFGLFSLKDPVAYLLSVKKDVGQRLSDFLGESINSVTDAQKRFSITVFK